MLNIIENLPDHVVGVEAFDEVSAHDLKNVVIPAIQKNLDKYNEINYLLVLRTGVENWTPGAWVEDMWTGMKHYTKWKKIAVVTNEKAVEKLTNGFSFLSIGDVKGFKLDELEQAKKWVSEA